MTTSTSSRIWSDEAVHPGETLVEELAARELDVDDFAATVRMSPEDFRAVVEGRSPVTARLALALEVALDVEATFWMNLQTAHDLTLARIELSSAALPR